VSVRLKLEMRTRSEAIQMSLIETIVGELQRIGRVNALAALAALVAALCAAHGFRRQMT
jgi:hypothetical protein